MLARHLPAIYSCLGSMCKAGRRGRVNVCYKPNVVGNELRRRKVIFSSKLHLLEMITSAGVGEITGMAPLRP